jgi:CheY-like chemotaxis protein
MVCRILVADDSSTIQKVIRIGLSSIPSVLKAVSSYAEACKLAEGEAFDVIIADAGLPGISEANDFLRLTERAKGAGLILLVGSYDMVREGDLRAAGFENIIKKPFAPEDLPQLVQRLIGEGAAGKSGHPAAEFSLGNSGMPHSLFSLEDPPVAASRFDIGESQNTDTGGAAPQDFAGFGGGRFSMPSMPEIELGQRGRPAFDLSSSDSSDLQKSFSQSENLKDLTNLTMAPGRFEQNNANAGLSDSIEALIKAELPALVGRAVERYCAEHFKGAAREALVAELRRLADEKARYLVDQ